VTAADFGRRDPFGTCASSNLHRLHG